MEERPVAVFGGGGFIGSHLVRRLVEEGREVVVVDITREKLADVLPHDRIEFIEADVGDPGNDQVNRRVVEDAELVVDLIAYANPQQYVDMPLEVVELNYDQNLKIVEDCVETDTRLIQFSTSEVYGKLGGRTGEDVVFREDESDLVMGPVGNHRWIYATAKQLLERMVNAHGIENGLDWTIVRPFNFIGQEMDYIITDPDEGTPRVFAGFMSALLYDHPMNVVDGGENRRAFTYIEDAIDAIELIIENPDGHFSNEVVNIGTPGNETTMMDLAHLMRDVYQELSPDGSLPPLNTPSGEEFYGEGYEDCERRVPDIGKLEAVGWEPEYDLREMLEETMAYYVEEHEKELEADEEETGEDDEERATEQRVR
ncbi:MAG: bifunctional UDP-4-keto-pentose/UDP-xylose synthase [Haloarcula sp.]